MGIRGTGTAKEETNLRGTIEEKDRRGVLNGYMTLEAAMVFPMVFAMVIMLLYATFFCTTNAE